MVFCGLFPIDADRYGDLREALGRLQLNDAALQYEPEARAVQPDPSTCCCSRKPGNP
jgi:translation elongation factor EF-4